MIGTAVCECAGTRLSEFTARNLSNSLWALAKMGHNPGEIMLNAMAAEVAKKLGGCNAQNLVRPSRLLHIWIAQTTV